MTAIVTATLGAQLLHGTDGFGAKFVLAGIDGWDGSSASTLQPVQKTRGPGGWPSPRNLTPRPLAPAGTVSAATPADLVAVRDRLNAAASLEASTLTVVDADIERYCTVYRQDAPLFVRTNAVTAAWSLHVTALDPRKFADDVSASTGLPSVTGGLTIPFTIPFTIASVVVPGTCTLTNPGNYLGPLNLRIDGPSSGPPLVGPVVTHRESGIVLAFPTLQLGVGEWLDIDCEARTALANGQAPRTPSTRGWPGFLPGVNTLAFTAVSGSGLLTATGTKAWQ